MAGERVQLLPALRKATDPNPRMNLPSFVECYAKCTSGTAATLEKFIANFEPEGREEVDTFREQLAKLIEETNSLGSKFPSQTIDIDQGRFENPLHFFWNLETNTYEQRK